MNSNYKKKLIYFFELLAVMFVFWLAVRNSYDQEKIFQFFDQDFFQILSDSFRKFQIGIDGNIQCIMDFIDYGNNYHISWGPFPAIIYAAFDMLWSFLFNGLFPKVFLFLCMACIHSLLIYKISYIESGDRPSSIIFLSIYLFSFPMYIFLNSDVQTEHISALYGATLFLGGIYCYRLFERNSKSMVLFIAGMLLGCAILTRISYWLYSFIFSLFFLFSNKLCIKRKIIVLAPIVTSVSAFFIYNFIRFGEVLNFGERYMKYHGSWVEVINDMYIIPPSFVKYFLQAQELFNDFMGGLLHVHLIDHPYLYNLYFHEGFNYFSVTRPHFFGLLIIPGLYIWFKKGDKFKLVGFAAILFVLNFWFYHIQTLNFRSIIHFWPFLFVLSMWALVNLVQMKCLKSSKYVLPVLALILLAWTKVDMDDLKKKDVAHNLSGPMTYPHEYTAMTCHKTGPYAKLDCSKIHPMIDFLSLENHGMEFDYNRLGLYRESEKNCRMLFFSGATMQFVQNRECEVVLEFSLEEKAPQCQNIDIYLSGKNVGAMSEKMPAVCYYNFSNDFHTRRQVYFYIRPMKLLKDRVDNLRVQTMSYAFKSMAVNCH